MVIKRSITASLIITIIVLTCELCFAPRINNQVIPAIITTAGMLIIPPSIPGGLINCCGKFNPNEVKIFTI